MWGFNPEDLIWYYEAYVQTKYFFHFYCTLEKFRRLAHRLMDIIDTKKIIFCHHSGKETRKTP